jgi:hypothetical protein
MFGPWFISGGNVLCILLALIEISAFRFAWPRNWTGRIYRLM